MMNPRHRSHPLANSRNIRRRNTPSRGHKKSCLLIACAVVAVVFSVRRSLSFRFSLEQWSSLSTVMTETYYETADKSSGSFLGGEGAAGTTTSNTNDSNKDNANDERNVYFLEADAAALSDEDLATGMWWQSIASFSKFPVTQVRLRSQSPNDPNPKQESLRSSITGVYAAASGIHRDRALMTRDWLDLAVESVGLYHHYFFGVGTSSGATDDMMLFYPTLQEQLQTYIDTGTSTPKNDPPSKTSTAPQQTIALIPFTVHGSISDSDITASSSNHQQFLELKVQALTATLVSLQRVGMGRAVVVGLSDLDQQWAHAAFEQVQQHVSEKSSSSSSSSSSTSTTMQLAFVVAPGLSPEVIQNHQQASLSLPHLLQTQALHGLDVALRGSPSLLGAPVQSWLGSTDTAGTDTAGTTGTTQKWRYVYWTQPNLLLHTRTSSLPILQEALDQGAILTAHRLPVIPHVADFTGVVARTTAKANTNTALVPATGSFATILTLDGDSAACCDAGSGRPALDISQPNCDVSDTPWWQCGLVSVDGTGTATTATNTDTDTDPHRRKVPYAWMRLQHPGTGMTLMAASESARRCTPVASGSCGLAEGSVVTSSSSSSSSSLISSLSSWAWGAGVSEQQPDSAETKPQDSAENSQKPPESPNDNSVSDVEIVVKTNRNVDDSDDEIVVVPNRTVLFTKRPEFQDGDPYSGMWWLDIQNFQQINAGGIAQLEVASFVVFRAKGGSRVRMTRDWFDFAVEHLSMYQRMFGVNGEKTGIPFDQMKNTQLLGYIQKAKAYPLQKEAAPASTIVLCAFNVQKTLQGGPHYQTGEKENELRIYSLAATLASLWQVGMGRVVVVGGNSADEVAATEAFNLVKEKTKSSMDLSFVISNNATTGLDNNFLTPKQAIAGLQLALNGKLNASHTQEWLGDSPKKWKYVYFTEPDLILSSRPGSIQALSSELESGNVLAAHRLQPIPHALDFPGYEEYAKVVPAVGNFSASHITDVDSAEYVCCDAGNGRPGRDIEDPKCGTFWWQCGFNMKRNYLDIWEVHDAHRRKVPYTWLRFKTGTGSVMMATTEHARQCTLIHHGSCEDTGSETSIPDTGLTKSVHQMRIDAKAAPVLHDDVTSRTLSKPESPNDASHEIIVTNRTVLFTQRPEFQDGDPYSGMWWQNTENFQQINAGGIGHLEATSFVVFNSKGGGRVRMTRDWFDLAVEHLSMYQRMFGVNGEKTGIPFEQIKNTQLLGYIQKAKAYPLQKEAAPASTIVLCAFNVKKMMNGGPHYQTGEKENQLRIHSLAATLASLWQVGMGRVVVVGGNSADEVAATEAFDLIREKTKTSMELSFVISNNATTGLDNNFLTPKQAIAGLQLALNGKLNASHTQEWLGDSPKRWKYVYFTEPDLILSSRPGSIQALSSQLESGNVLAAHRLQPIPHELDFPGFKALSKVVPAVGNFSASHITDVDSAEYVCCDAGNGRPGRDITQPECGSFWWQCGFDMRNKNYLDISEVYDAHRRKVPYTWLRFSTGTGSVMMATTEHARQCTLIHHGSCEDTGSEKSVTEK